MLHNGERMNLRDWQRIIEETYGARDRERGLFETFAWLVEEMGEVSRALRRGGPEELQMEFSDALAWLISVANLAGVDLERAMDRYREGCPKCGHRPCRCPQVARSKMQDREARPLREP